MRDTIIEDPAKLGTEEHFVYNKEFHSAVLDGCGNTLLCIAAQPVFSVLQTNLGRDAMSQRFAKRINEDHRAILAAIEDADAEAAAEQMQRPSRLPEPHVSEDVAQSTAPTASTATSRSPSGVPRGAVDNAPGGR